MKSDFMLALTQLSAEKNLPADVVITAVEAALVSAYRKDNFARYFYIWRDAAFEVAL